MKKSLTIILTLLVSGVCGTAHSAPGDLGHRFNHNNIGIRDVTLIDPSNPSTTYYGPNIDSAGAEFSAAGNFSFYYAQSNLNPPFNGQVAFYQMSLGPYGALATALGTTVMINHVMTI